MTEIRVPLQGGGGVARDSPLIYLAKKKQLFRNVSNPRYPIFKDNVTTDDHEIYIIDVDTSTKVICSVFSVN